MVGNRLTTSHGYAMHGQTNVSPAVANLGKCHNRSANYNDFYACGSKQYRARGMGGQIEFSTCPLCGLLRVRIPDYGYVKNQPIGEWVDPTGLALTSLHTAPGAAALAAAAPILYGAGAVVVVGGAVAAGVYLGQQCPIQRAADAVAGAIVSAFMATPIKCTRIGWSNWGSPPAAPNAETCTYACTNGVQVTIASDVLTGCPPTLIWSW